MQGLGFEGPHKEATTSRPKLPGLKQSPKTSRKPHKTLKRSKLYISCKFFRVYGLRFGVQGKPSHPDAVQEFRVVFDTGSGRLGCAKSWFRVSGFGFRV